MYAESSSGVRTPGRRISMVRNRELLLGFWVSRKRSLNQLNHTSRKVQKTSKGIMGRFNEGCNGGGGMFED